MSALQVTAVQPASRMGLKGPDAAALLQQAGIPVPALPNRVLIGTAHNPPSIAAPVTVRVLRLGNTEFILEQDEGHDALAAVRSLARSAGLRAWPVVRADCSLLLTGGTVFERLSRVCAFDFAQLMAQPDMAVMTLLADISVTLVLEPPASVGAAHAAASPAPVPPCLRLWADPGFATYLVQTLRSLSSDLPSHGVHA